MKVILENLLRKLLCIIGLITTQISISNAVNLNSQHDTVEAQSSVVIIDSYASNGSNKSLSKSDSLTLEKNYVTFNADITAIAEYKSFLQLGTNYLKDLAAAAAKKTYSLLNWKNATYDKEPQVEPYKRLVHFGRWINDPSDNLCFNTRAQVLVRDSKKEVVFKGNNRCVVDRGDWDDPYTNETLLQSREVQIDHMVPLKNAYISGAYQWSFRNRCLYANYMGAEYHLISSDARENMRKGDRSPAEYMPPNDKYACTYVKNWLSIKFLWNLKMSKTETVAIQDIIKTHHCNVDEFKITDKEVTFQKKFMKDNLNLCEEIEKRRSKAAAINADASARPTAVNVF